MNQIRPNLLFRGTNLMEEIPDDILYALGFPFREIRIWCLSYRVLREDGRGEAIKLFRNWRKTWEEQFNEPWEDFLLVFDDGTQFRPRQFMEFFLGKKTTAHIWDRSN